MLKKLNKILYRMFIMALDRQIKKRRFLPVYFTFSNVWIIHICPVDNCFLFPKEDIMDIWLASEYASLLGSKLVI